MAVREKYQDLQVILRSLGKIVVCFSGGVDSTLLLKAAVETLGTARVLAVMARSDTYPAGETDQAVAYAMSLGVPYRVIETGEMEDENYLRNGLDRCYHCKKSLFGTVREITKDEGYDAIVEGSNLDDTEDFRPGRRAGAEAGVRSPLLEAGLTKKEIRELSRMFTLPTADKPSMACLASRILYGTRIEPAVLHRIEASEAYLKSLGIGQVRVRYHGDLARVEVSHGDFGKVLTNDADIIARLEALGFLYVTLDLKGYRTGSMNEVITRAAVGPKAIL